MENTQRLIEIIKDYKWTTEEFASAKDLYEYTMWDDRLSRSTLEECEIAFNS